MHPAMIREHPKSTAIIAIIVLLAAAQVWLSHIRYETSLVASETRQTQEKIKSEIHQLDLELASLTRPERLRKIARTELNMAPPHPMQVIQP